MTDRARGAGETGETIRAFEIADLLVSLTEKSLAVYDEATGRFRLLETIRTYSREVLLESAEAEAEVEMLRDRRRDYFVPYAEVVEPKLYGPEQGLWLDRLEADHDNLRAVLDRSAAAPSDGEAGLKLCAAVWWFWYLRGLFGEGRERCAVALAHPSGQEPTPARAKTLNGAGALAGALGNFEAAEELYQTALRINHTLGDQKAQAANLHNLGILAHNRGRLDLAASLYGQALDLCRLQKHRTGEASGLTGLAMVARDRGDFKTARIRLQEALEINRELGNLSAQATVLNNLGLVAYSQGDHRAARRVLQQALAINRRLGNPARAASNLHNLGLAARGQGAYEEARSLHREALTLWHACGDRQAVADCLQAMGSVAKALGAPAEAAFLWSAAHRLREEIGCPIPLGDVKEYNRDVAAAQVALGVEAFTEAWYAGRAVTLEEAVAQALQEDGRRQPPPG